MKKTTLKFSALGLLLFALVWSPAFAAVSVKGTAFSMDQLKMGDLMVFDEGTIMEKFAHLSPKEFLALDAKDVQRLTGEKMKFADRMTFNIVQRQARKQLKRAEKAASLDQVEKADAFEFKLLWFILGILFTLITLIVSLFFGKDAILSTLLGIAVAAIVAGIIALFN